MEEILEEQEIVQITSERLSGNQKLILVLILGGTLHKKTLSLYCFKV